MDRFTILREDLDAMAAAGLSDEGMGMILLAMVRYGLDGQDPDFTPKSTDTEDLIQSAMARAAFAMLRGRIDKYVAKSTNAKKNEPAPEAIEPEQDETEENRNESKQIETHQDKDKDNEDEQGKVDPVTPESETHTEFQRQGERRGRARARPGWFDPMNPEAPDDGAWAYSQAARRATAQRILDHGHLQVQHTVTEAGEVGREVFDALTEAMQLGISPGECVRLLDGCRKSWEYELRLKARIVSAGGTETYPEWADQVQELREELIALESSACSGGLCRTG